MSVSFSSSYWLKWIFNWKSFRTKKRIYHGRTSERILSLRFAVCSSMINRMERWITHLNFYLISFQNWLRIHFTERLFILLVIPDIIWRKYMTASNKDENLLFIGITRLYRIFEIDAREIFNNWKVFLRNRSSASH